MVVARSYESKFRTKITPSKVPKTLSTSNIRYYSIFIPNNILSNISQKEDLQNLQVFKYYLRSLCFN